MTEYDLTRLPKWAQQRIATLEMRLAEANEKLSVGPSESRGFLNFYSDSPTPLGRDPHVRFLLEAGERPCFDVRMIDDELYVMGSETVAVKPGSSNTFRVALVKR